MNSANTYSNYFKKFVQFESISLGRSIDDTVHCFTIATLRGFCKQVGLKNYSKLTKHALAKSLWEYQMKSTEQKEQIYLNKFTVPQLKQIYNELGLNVLARKKNKEFYVDNVWVGIQNEKEKEHASLYDNSIVNDFADPAPKYKKHSDLPVGEIKKFVSEQDYNDTVLARFAKKSSPFATEDDIQIGYANCQLQINIPEDCQDKFKYLMERAGIFIQRIMYDFEGGAKYKERTMNEVIRNIGCMSYSNISSQYPHHETWTRTMYNQRPYCCWGSDKNWMDKSVVRCTSCGKLRFQSRAKNPKYKVVLPENNPNLTVAPRNEYCHCQYATNGYDWNVETYPIKL